MRCIDECARMNTRAIIEPLITNAAAIGNDAFRREDHGNAIARRRSLTRCAGLLADRDRRQVRSDRHA
jgi:hypothetical protein